jgi:hypothetical protein
VWTLIDLTTGFLYFLAPGILYAFKKPLLFLPFSSITSISYTSVLQRTFNLNVVASTISPDGTVKEEEIEFSMLDQADFAGIDAYIKEHGLNDASLAAGRRAKKYGVNDPKVKDVEGATAAANGEANDDEDMEDGETELQKAERLLQDQEDEEEEVRLVYFPYDFCMADLLRYRITLMRALMMGLAVKKMTRRKVGMLRLGKETVKYSKRKRNLLRRRVGTRTRGRFGGSLWLRSRLDY